MSIGSNEHNISAPPSSYNSNRSLSSFSTETRRYHSVGYRAESGSGCGISGKCYPREAPMMSNGRLARFNRIN